MDAPELSPPSPSFHHNDLAVPDDEENSRMCFPANSAIFRKKKIASFDVASVGNASDTPITEKNHAVREVNVRDLHESAKLALNNGEYTVALEYFEAILAAQTSRFGAVHPSVGAAMHNVGVCRQRMGQYEVAANLFGEAVQVRKQTAHSLEVAASLSKLGTSLASLGKYEEAFDSIRQALAISQEELGTHKTTAQMMCHLGIFYFETGEFYAAQATFRDAYVIYQKVWPQAEDRDAVMAQMTDTLCNIGSIQNRRKQYSKATATFKEALDLQLGIMGCHHPRVISTMDNLAYSHSKNRDYVSALSCYQKMFRAQSKTDFSPDCLETFRKQLLMYEKLKRVGDAIDATKDTLRRAKTMLPRNDKKIEQLKQLLECLKKKQRAS